MPYLTTDFFSRDTLTVARELIGATLVFRGCEVRIVETEAYTTDAASHTVTRRHTATLMRETFGHIYIYLIYGMHWCMNFTTEREGIGAVLIRAAEPLKGLEQMRKRRGVDDLHRLCRGPGCVCQALGIDDGLHGQRIGRTLKVRQREAEPEIAVSPRIGISQATELDWRFFVPDSPFVTRHPLSKRTRLATIGGRVRASTPRGRGG